MNEHTDCHAPPSGFIVSRSRVEVRQIPDFVGTSTVVSSLRTQCGKGIGENRVVSRLSVVPLKTGKITVNRGQRTGKRCPIASSSCNTCCQQVRTLPSCWC